MYSAGLKQQTGSWEKQKLRIEILQQPKLGMRLPLQ